jgi:hypothetical protein
LKKLLEWYYGHAICDGKGINYEVLKVDRSCNLSFEQQDKHATIGYYIHQLEPFKRLVLACDYMLKLSESATSQRISGVLKRKITQFMVMEAKQSAQSRLRSDFKAIGLIENQVTYL